MNKEEILARSREEGNNEYEKQALERAGKFSAQVGMVVCCIIAAASVAVTGRVNSGCWVIYFTIHATLFWTKYRYLRDRHEGIVAAISTAAGILFAALYVMELAGVQGWMTR